MQTALVLIARGVVPTATFAVLEQGGASLSTYISPSLSLSLSHSLTHTLTHTHLCARASVLYVRSCKLSEITF